MRPAGPIERVTVTPREPPAGERQPVQLSVIMPAHRGGQDLIDSIEALMASDLDRSHWELIVSVDGDSMRSEPDHPAITAMRYADVVVRLPGKPRGPSYVRNRAAEVARGPILVFIDSDVCVHTDTLRRFLELFRTRPKVQAAFGSYDDAPRSRGIVSQYRNLLHHYVHSTSCGPAETFWAGCGAIRAEAFHQVGMYDEWHFSSPQIEDIELGRRLRRAGHQIVLDADIQACHLKHWTLGSTIMTDLKSRGVPWTRLLLHEGPSPGASTLNVSPKHWFCVAFTWIAFGVLPAALVFRTWWPLLVSLFAVLLVAVLNAGFLRLLFTRARPTVALAAIPLLVTFYFANGLSAISGWLAYAMVGAPLPPPEVLAFEEIGVETWPPIPKRPKESVWYEHGI